MLSDNKADLCREIHEAIEADPTLRTKDLCDARGIRPFELYQWRVDARKRGEIAPAPEWMTRGGRRNRKQKRSPQRREEEPRLPPVPREKAPLQTFGVPSIIPGYSVVIMVPTNQVAHVLQQINR